MALPLKKKRRKSRKRWLPYLATGFVGFHLAVFLLLTQCSRVAPGYEGEASYIRVESNEVTNLSLNFEAPPERMFYQFASAPLSSGHEELQAISDRHWDGYKTLVALKVEDYTPMESYRLTMKKVDDSDSRMRRPVDFGPVFRTIVVRGVPVQPITKVPEPSLSFLLGLSAVLLLKRQRKK